MARATATTSASRPLALLVLGRFLSRMAVEGCYFVGVLGTAAFALGVDALSMSTIALVNALFGGIGMLVSGPLCDRIGPRRTCLVADGALVLIFAVAFLVELDLVGLGAVTACWTFAMGFQTTGFVAYPPHLFGDELLPRANGLMETAANLAVVAGPVAGGAVTLVAGTQAVFLIGAVATVLSTIPLLPLREDGEVVAHRRRAEGGEAVRVRESGSARGTALGRWGANVAAGFSYTMGHGVLRLLLAMGFMGFFVFGAFDSLESLFYRDVLRVSADWIGWLTAICGLGSVVGSALTMALPARWRDLRGCAVMTLVMGVGTMVYVGTPLVAVAAAGQLLVGLGWGALVPTQNLLVQEGTPVDMVGRVGSVMRIGFQAAGVIPLFFVPFLAELLGVQVVLFSASCICAAAGLGFILLTFPRAGAASRH